MPSNIAVKQALHMRQDEKHSIVNITIVEADGRSARRAGDHSIITEIWLGAPTKNALALKYRTAGTQTLRQDSLTNPKPDKMR